MFAPSAYRSLSTSGFRRSDKAMEWLEKAFAMHDPGVLQLKVKPAYDPLRSDPRFVRLLQKIGVQ